MVLLGGGPHCGRTGAAEDEIRLQDGKVYYRDNYNLICEVTSVNNSEPSLRRLLSMSARRMFLRSMFRLACENEHNKLFFAFSSYKDRSKKSSVSPPYRPLYTAKTKGENATFLLRLEIY